MNLLDRARIETAVQSYDVWLDLRGAPWRRRRGLRRELRANLIAAADHVGSREAVDRVGSTRLMAAEALPLRADRPRCCTGFAVSLVAAAVVVLVEFLAALAWIDGVIAANPQGSVSGTMSLFPASSLSYTEMESGFAFAIAPGWLGPIIGVVLFVLVARPWRAWRAGTGREGRG